MHWIEPVQQRQVALQRQTVPSGGIDIGKGNVGLADEVAATHRAVLANEAAHQAAGAACAMPVFEQRQQRALAGVKRHRIDEVKALRLAQLAQLAQLGVDIAAAQRDADARVLGLDRLGGDAQSGAASKWPRSSPTKATSLR